jgi:SAM-dependent methyltransferase
LTESAATSRAASSSTSFVIAPEWLIETERIKQVYDENAERYDAAEPWERRLLGADARRIVREARGDVLELAIGSGRNLPLYASGVRITGVDVSSGMLRLARRRAATLGLDVTLLEGDVQALPFPDASFDTVLTTFSLCTIPDDRAALAEARRVLRPGGTLLLTEHVRSPNGLVRLVEHVLDPLMRRSCCDHLLRDPLDHLADVGFVDERVERERLGVLERVWATPYFGGSDDA